MFFQSIIIYLTSYCHFFQFICQCETEKTMFVLYHVS